MLPLYHELRDNNIFALFVDRIPGDVWGRIPDKHEVRWSAYRDLKSQYAIAMKDSPYLADYKNKTLIYSGDVRKTIELISKNPA